MELHKKMLYAEFVLNVMIKKFLADKELERKTKEIALQNKGKDTIYSRDCYFNIVSFCKQ